jgi:hypothetical protein
VDERRSLQPGFASDRVGDRPETRQSACGSNLE